VIREHRVRESASERNDQKVSTLISRPFSLWEVGD